MSNENKQTTPKNVPALRFPEFLESGAWERKKISSMLTIGSGKDYKHLNKGEIPVFGTGGYMLSVDDFLYDGDSVGIGRKGTIDKPVFLSGKFWTVDTLFYTHSFINVLPKFVYLLFQKINWYKFNEASGVPSLSKITVGKIEVSKPTLPEQQKIADCLSSLDEQITSEGEQLTALEAHKKGLMQQLFPAPEHTTPARRFPEFLESGEWSKEKLNKISPSIFDGTHQTPKYQETGVPFFSVENIVSGNKNKFISKNDWLRDTKKNKPEKNDILITRIGKIGFSAIVNWDYEFGIYVTLAVVKKSDFFNSYYLHLYFQTETYQIEILSKSLQSAVPCKINMEELRETSVLLPSIPEQQKIADCLSSLDNLITAQRDKIDALKQHKKGLMQGLFPSREGV